MQGELLNIHTDIIIRVHMKVTIYERMQRALLYTRSDTHAGNLQNTDEKNDTYTSQDVPTYT